MTNAGQAYIIYQARSRNQMERWLSWSKAHDWKSCRPLKGLGGSNPPLSATSERVTLVPIFYFIKNQSPAPLFLLFRKRSRSARLLGCKRSRDGSLSLPPFCGCACGAKISKLFTLPTSRRTFWFAVFLCKNTASLYRLPLLFPKRSRCAYAVYL